MTIAMDEFEPHTAPAAPYFISERENERERELRKEGCVVPSRMKTREGLINVTELHWAKPTMGLC
jgi:hypothetical protein